MVEYELKLNNLLLELFQKHNINGFIIEEDNTIFLDKCIKTHCHLYDKTSTQITVVQLDVIFEIGLDKYICESGAGLGENLDEAVADSFNSFVRNSFHTIFAAFFSSEYDGEVLRNVWFINSCKYEVVCSPIGIRGKKPETFSERWIAQFEETLQNQKLDTGINWIRLFYAISNNQVTTCEVLVNNETEYSLQDIASKFDIPLSKDFYTLRLLYILQNGFDFGRLSAIIAWACQYYGDAHYEVIKNIFSGLGMSALDIEKAYIMIPLGISQVFIEKIVSNSPTTKAIIMNKEKQAFEIDLKDECFFINSYEWAKSAIDNTIKDSSSLIQILQMSSRFNVLNDALNKGSNPEDLEFSETIVFLDDYPSHIKKDIDHVHVVEKKKPFWKFW